MRADGPALHEGALENWVLQSRRLRRGRLGAERGAATLHLHHSLGPQALLWAPFYKRRTSHALEEPCPGPQS